MLFIFESGGGALTRELPMVPKVGISAEWHCETVTVTTRAK
ncbi:MAG: hypothetical protein OES84_00660 [Kiritimatiellaceae bacterium]|nr:hypothetical protein [Kiritimatiellaceae bacterium]